MEFWNTLGDYLTYSGWTASLIEAGVATSGTPESFLTAFHILGTCHSHQVTIAALHSYTKSSLLSFFVAGDGKSLENEHGSTESHI